MNITHHVYQLGAAFSLMEYFANKPGCIGFVIAIGDSQGKFADKEYTVDVHFKEDEPCIGSLIGSKNTGS